MSVRSVLQACDSVSLAQQLHRNNMAFDWTIAWEVGSDEQQPV